MKIVEIYFTTKLLGIIIPIILVLLTLIVFAVVCIKNSIKDHILIKNGFQYKPGLGLHPPREFSAEYVKGKRQIYADDAYEMSIMALRKWARE